MATLNDVVRYDRVFITPYHDNNKGLFSFIEELPSIELSKAECITFIELIEADEAILALIEEDLQCVANLNDGTPLLSTWLSLTEFNQAVTNLVTASAFDKPTVQSAMSKWINTRCNQVVLDFIRKS